MSDDISLIEMFEGLTTEEAKQLRSRIAQAVQNEYKTFQENKTMNLQDIQALSDQIDALGEQIRLAQELKQWQFEQDMGQAWEARQGQTRSIPQFEQPAAPFDVDNANRELERLAGQMEQLSKRSGNEAEMREVAKRIEKIENSAQAHETNQQRQYTARYAGERQQLVSDLDQLGALNAKLSKDATLNAPDIDKLERQIAARSKRLEDIDNFRAVDLQWSPNETE